VAKDRGDILGRNAVQVQLAGVLDRGPRTLEEGAVPGNGAGRSRAALPMCEQGRPAIRKDPAH
jgi:hypothetical protein